MFGLNFFGTKKPASDKTAELYEKSEAAAWAETLNPLRGLSIDRAIRIYDNARIGAYADLQWLYNEIETADPTLLTCVERRSTALLETDTTVRMVDADKARGFDEKLAEDQAGFLTMCFADAARGNLNEALEHLGLAFFRGFSHVRPLYAPAMNTLDGFDILDGWNFCRDIQDGTWWWNPDAASVPTSNFKQIPAGELVSVVRSRHVDYPTLEIYIRRALGDKKYGIFLERYGVPPVIIVMPDNMDPDKAPLYEAAALKVAKGASGTAPYGSTINYATEARGVNPFTEFLKHQQELIVLMSTGGILTSLSSPTGIGGGASDTHEKTWRTIIRRDCKLITTPVNRVVVTDLLNANFPGRPHLAYFDFADPQPTADEVFGTAAKAKEAGYRVRQADLEEKSGYTLEPILDAAAVAPIPPAPTTAAQATAPAAGQPDEAAASASNVAEAAMNGAQVTSLVDIISKVQTGEITRSVGPAVIKAAFPLLDDAQISQMIPPETGKKPASIPLDPVDPAANKRDGVANPLQIAPVAPEGSVATDAAGKGTPPENGQESALAAMPPDPVEAALKALEAGATPEEVQAAYDQAAKKALAPEAVAAQAERMATELDAAAAAGKEGK